MAKIVITNYTEFGDIPEKKTLVVMGEENMEAQDGYHTFGELYGHRIALFIALCKILYNDPQYQTGQKSEIWRSEVHSDGTNYKGWFILGIGKEKGKQITYHIPGIYWQDTGFAEILEKAPEFDGHTPQDVLERLKNL